MINKETNQALAWQAARKPTASRKMWKPAGTGNAPGLPINSLGGEPGFTPLPAEDKRQ